MTPRNAADDYNRVAYEKALKTARGILLAAHDELQRSELRDVYKGKDTGPEASLLLRMISIVEHKLRKVIRSKPTGERELQDAFENLLIGADVVYSRETDSIEYSSKTYTPDFTVTRADLAIELKLCGHARREKEIIAQINDDVLAYGTKFGNQLFIVYDCGFIRDIERFTGHFEANEGVIVRVVKQ